MSAAMAPMPRAQRLAQVATSPIVRIAEAANARRAAGFDVISLSTGEPDFATPGHVVEAAHRAAIEGRTRYPPTAGAADLRAAIAERAGVAPERVIVSTGAKQVIFNAMIATLDPGDEIVLTAPYWSSYVDIVRICGGVPIVIDTAPETFKLSPEKLEAAITPRTRWLFLNNPGNPSGVVLSEGDQKVLAEVLRRHPHVAILSDEIYRAISFVPFASFRDVAPDLDERLLTVDGVSKAYSMTGWRIGWGIAPLALVEDMTVVQGQSTSGASTISQAAAFAALTGPQDLIGDRREIFRRRGIRLKKGLEASGQFGIAATDGAFYLFASCDRLLGRLAQGRLVETDVNLCDVLLEAANVAVVPGSAFGSPGHLRISYAYRQEDLDEACSRIVEACRTFDRDLQYQTNAASKGSLT